MLRNVHLKSLHCYLGTDQFILYLSSTDLSSKKKKIKDKLILLASKPFGQEYYVLHVMYVRMYASFYTNVIINF